MLRGDAAWMKPGASADCECFGEVVGPTEILESGMVQLFSSSFETRSGARRGAAQDGCVVSPKASGERRAEAGDHGQVTIASSLERGRLRGRRGQHSLHLGRREFKQLPAGAAVHDLQSDWEIRLPFPGWVQVVSSRL
jgi:hypothetical protein